MIRARPVVRWVTTCEALVLNVIFVARDVCPSAPITYSYMSRQQAAPRSTFLTPSTLPCSPSSVSSHIYFLFRFGCAYHVEYFWLFISIFFFRGPRSVCIGSMCLLGSSMLPVKLMCALYIAEFESDCHVRSYQS